MPTVPPTFVPRDGGESHLIGAVPDIGDIASSPTPDPDLDDSVLVPVVTGDGIGAITQSTSLLRHKRDAHIGALKPLGLADLSLHSPSSIVGTPFDVSPRFEYPFPPSSTTLEPDYMHPSGIHSFGGQFLPYPGGPLTSYPFARPEVSGYSPTHPKHIPRDVPIPPSLAAKKKWSVGMSLTSKHSRKRSRSASPESCTSIVNVPGSSHSEDGHQSTDGEDISHSSEGGKACENVVPVS